MDVLPKRFEKYGLTIHPEKTRLVPFERPDRVPDRTDPERRQPPGSFDLLGFTHYWARSRNGNWVVKRKTSTSRFRRGLQALSRWCQINRHQPLATQHQTLSQKLMGHFAYYGITGNSMPWDDSGVLPKDYGGTGFLVANGVVGCLGLDSIACWSVTRFRRR